MMKPCYNEFLSLEELNFDSKGCHMTAKQTPDYLLLPLAYRVFYDRVRTFIPQARLFCDPLRTLAYGTDASFYRLIPKIVVAVKSAPEVSRILQLANQLAIPVTFRAAGTSLSGQAVSDSVLLLLASGWKGCRLHDGGAKISLEPGVIGADANGYLATFKRKIGPDPASIAHCMIGGIAANNASGMCCGIAQNSYQTVESMKMVWPDGSLLDTDNSYSRRSFVQFHPELIAEITKIRQEIMADAAVEQRIRDKYRIKNTTGYSMNAFVDYADPVDILLHLMIGSEGTLGFISEITYLTVIEHAHKASALMLFPDIEAACKATMLLKHGPIAAAELMDRASLRAVEHKDGMPPYLKSLGSEAAALLVETRASDPSALGNQVTAILELLRPIPTLLPIEFSDQKVHYEKLWDVRRGLFPAVGAARKIGTTVVIEDVAFPIARMAEATVELQTTMREYGYEEGIIFGHALDGNLHFVFTQDFGAAAEIERYQRFIEKVCHMVVEKYDGSLKGEHGTGRNMAPFVALEWGEQIYGWMKRVKQACDPHHILNPDVIINDNPQVHLENLKFLPKAHELVDKCIECGFCEQKCPSRRLTLTPRQRIVVQREISPLTATDHHGSSNLKRLERDYRYFGNQTCATDGLCATTCPVGINTGELTKALRCQGNSKFAGRMAAWVAGCYPVVLASMRMMLDVAHVAHCVLGTPLMTMIAKGLRMASGNRVPRWNPWLPKGVPRIRQPKVTSDHPRQVVYFPSCLARTMGPARRDHDQRPLFEATLSVLHKAGYAVIFPKFMSSLCCGLPWDSKGFFEVADARLKQLEIALLEASQGGKYPVLCDTSPCVYRMKRKVSSLKIYEPVEFIATFLMDALDFHKLPESVAIHITCSSVKMGISEKFKTLAHACAAKVIIPETVGCCGFAGDKGFTCPELNASALAELKSSLPPDCRSGYSNSRTCEIGLSWHSGIAYQSLVYLVDRCTSGAVKK